MRYSMIFALAAAGLLVLGGGCTPQGSQTVSIDQEPPVRSDADLRPGVETGPYTDVDMGPSVGGQAFEPVEAAPPPPPAPQVRTHTIQPRDTLYSLAQRYLGSGKRWQEIQAMNPGLDPKKLPVGKEILIPAQ